MKLIYKTSALCLLIGTLLACTQNTPKSIQKRVLSIDNIVVIDTFRNQLHFDTNSYKSEATFLVLYSGPIKDSINLEYAAKNTGLRNQQKHIKVYRTPKYKDLKIIVDTTLIIGSVPIPENSKISKRGDIKSYLLKVQNQSADTLFTNVGFFAPFIIEAKDSLGNWRPIQFRYNLFCATGKSEQLLAPNDILLTSCKLFEGKFQTQMRVVHENDSTILSNEFNGSINYRQFGK